MKKHMVYTLMLAAALGISACGNKPVNETVISETSIGGETSVDTASSVEEQPEPVILEPTHVGGFTISGDRLTATGGAYDKDGDLSNGAEALEWLVIADDVENLFQFCHCRKRITKVTDSIK